MTLPYHGQRWPASEGRHYHAALHFLSGDPERAAQAFAQSASDISTVVTWLQTRPDVDKTHIGFVGISLGAIVGHLAMGRDPRIDAGVSFLGAGDLPDIYRRSVLATITRATHPSQRPPAGMNEGTIDRILRRVDPLTFADGNRPRNVFLVAAARDVIIPPRDTVELWNALGRPPLRWVDTNHIGLRLAPDGPLRAAITYLQAVWASPSAEAASHIPAPTISVPTITAGVVDQWNGRSGLGFVPAMTYQILSLGTRADHISLTHADIGITPRGPFAAAAFTLNGYLDVGFASRFSLHSLQPPRPYVGLHLAF